MTSAHGTQRQLYRPRCHNRRKRCYTTFPAASSHRITAHICEDVGSAKYMKGLSEIRKITSICLYNAYHRSYCLHSWTQVAVGVDTSSITWL